MAKNRIKQIVKLRDEKVKNHLEQYAPVWLADEKPIPDEDSVQFNVVFLTSYIWLGKPSLLL